VVMILLPNWSSQGHDGHLSIHHRVQTRSGAHSISYPMGIRAKAAGSWSWPLTSI